MNFDQIISPLKDLHNDQSHRINIGHILDITHRIYHDIGPTGIELIYKINEIMYEYRGRYGTHESLVEEWRDQLKSEFDRTYELLRDRKPEERLNSDVVIEGFKKIGEDLPNLEISQVIERIKNLNPSVEESKSENLDDLLKDIEDDLFSTNLTSVRADSEYLLLDGFVKVLNDLGDN